MTIERLTIEDFMTPPSPQKLGAIILDSFYVNKKIPSQKGKVPILDRTQHHVERFHLMTSDNDAT
jgi:hypothetical protein